MSYQYRFSFVEHVLNLRRDLLEEINQQMLGGGFDPNDEESEELLMNKKLAIGHFFMKVYEQLSKQPYSLHFYLSFSKELIRSAEDLHQQMEECLDLMKKTLKIIRDSDLELFLHYNPEVAV